MGTLTEKLNYLLTTKDKIKQALIEKGISILEDTPFREYADKIKEISVGLSNTDLQLANATESKVLKGYKFYAGNDTLKTGTALSTQTTVNSSNLFNGIKAYDNGGNLITGSALSKETNVAAAKMFKGVTAYNNLGELITGNPTSTSVTSSKMFKGVTAYNSNGTLITGSPTATTVSASDIAKGKKAYTSSGTLLDGTGTLISGTAYKVYTGELYNSNSTIYLDNIVFGFVGSSGLATGQEYSMATAGGWAGAVSNQHVQLVLNYGQVISAGYITITSSYLHWEGDVITGVDYIIFCEV